MILSSRTRSSRLAVRGAAALALAAGLGITGPAAAQQIRAGSLVIHQPWTRATPPGAEVAAGYMRIENQGRQPDRLIGGSLRGTVRFELHRMSQMDGMMTMRPVDGGVTIPPGGSVTLAPAGLHIMYTGLKAPLVRNDSVEGTLVFEHAGTVRIALRVEGLGARGPEETGQGHKALDHVTMDPGTMDAGTMDPAMDMGQ